MGLSLKEPRESDDRIPSVLNALFLEGVTRERAYVRVRLIISTSHRCPFDWRPAELDSTRIFRSFVENTFAFCNVSRISLARAFCPLSPHRRRQLITRAVRRDVINSGELKSTTRARNHYVGCRGRFARKTRSVTRTHRFAE